jgi:hypothetical protein
MSLRLWPRPEADLLLLARQALDAAELPTALLLLNEVADRASPAYQRLHAAARTGATR